MAEALTYLYSIYAGFINMIFNDFQIASGVSVGWILVSVIVFGILINTILNIPKGISFRKEYKGNGRTHGSGN